MCFSQGSRAGFEVRSPLVIESFEISGAVFQRSFRVVEISSPVFDSALLAVYGPFLVENALRIIELAAFSVDLVAKAPDVVVIIIVINVGLFPSSGLPEGLARRGRELSGIRHVQHGFAEAGERGAHNSRRIVGVGHVGPRKGRRRKRSQGVESRARLVYEIAQTVDLCP